MSGSSTNLQALAAQFHSPLQQGDAPTPNSLIVNSIRNCGNAMNVPITNPLIVNSIQNCRNAMAMTGVPSSTQEGTIPTLLEINDSRTQRENSILSDFNGEDASVINEIDMENLFSEINTQDLFRTKHHKNKFWLIERVLRSKASKAIDDLITMGYISYYLKTHYVETPKVKKVIHVLSSCHAKAISLLRPCDWKTLAQAPAEQRDGLAPSYYLSPAAVKQISLKSIPLVPSFIAKNTWEKAEEATANDGIEPQRLELLKSCCKAPKIYLKLSKNLFSQWPPEKFAPAPPTNKKRRLTKGT